MLLDGRRLDPGAALEADVCIVGTGAGGMTAALALARSGLRIVVLEAGGHRQDALSRDASRGVLAAGTEHDPLELTRQRRLGGTTTQWGGRCAPLDAHDFQPRPWVANSGWPIGGDELRPFYEAAHELLHVGAYEYRAADALRDPSPLLGRDVAGFDGGKIWRWSPPVDFWAEYGRQLGLRPNVRIVHHATLARLHRDAAGAQASAATVVTAPGRQFTVRASCFVLAVGGVETARLLLASDGLGNEHDLVGRHYMTHPVASVGVLHLDDPSVLAAGTFRRTHDGMWSRRMLALDAAAQERGGLLNLAAALAYGDPHDHRHGSGLLSTYALVRHAMTRTGSTWKASATHRRYGQRLEFGEHMVNVARELPRVVAYGTWFARERWMRRHRLPAFMPPTHGRHLALRFDAEQTPETGNRITLSAERDRLGLRLPEVAFRVSHEDRESIRRSLEALGRCIESAGAGRFELPADPQWPHGLSLKGGTHAMGVARMAADPRHGVVDPWCRVHGCGNVYVAGSAVFPTGGAVGPTLTIVALALRAAAGVERRVRGQTAPVLGVASTVSA